MSSPISYFDDQLPQFLTFPISNLANIPGPANQTRTTGLRTPQDNQAALTPLLDYLIVITSVIFHSSPISPNLTLNISASANVPGQDSHTQRTIGIRIPKDNRSASISVSRVRIMKVHFTAKSDIANSGEQGTMRMGIVVLSIPSFMVDHQHPIS